jgi:hypothetical protein
VVDLRLEDHVQLSAERKVDPALHGGSEIVPGLKELWGQLASLSAEKLAHIFGEFLADEVLREKLSLSELNELVGRIQEASFIEGSREISLRLVHLKSHQAVLLVSEDAGDGVCAGKAHSFVKFFNDLVFVEVWGRGELPVAFDRHLLGQHAHSRE